MPPWMDNKVVLREGGERSTFKKKGGVLAIK
jgi:hypothetical protein